MLRGNWSLSFYPTLALQTSLFLGVNLCPIATGTPESKVKMTLTTKTSERPTTTNPVTSVTTLALWRWRQHWFLLLLTALGMIASVIIVCTVPLLEASMSTAGLRGVLRASPDSSEITFIANDAGLSTRGIEQTYQVVNQPLQQYLGTYLNGSPRFDFETPLFDVLSPSNPGSRNQMAIYAASMRAAAPHVTLVQGRLPQATSTTVEVAIAPDTASLLGLSVGSVINLNGLFRAAPGSPIATYSPFPMHVVGIFNVKPGDAFWHGYNFLPSALGDNAPTQYTVLASDQNVLAAFDRIAASMHTIETFFLQSSVLTWYYHLDPSRISIDQLDDLINRLATMQATIARNFSNPYMSYVPPYIESGNVSSTLLHTPGRPGGPEQFRSQLAVTRIPVAILTLQVLGLILFFVSMMAAVLIDRQADAIALLRGRGASRRQVFGAFLTQSAGLSLIALALGPPLACVTAYFVAQRLLPVVTQDAVNIISNAPLQALLSSEKYALAAACIAIVTMMVSLYRASRHTIWATDRQAASSMRRPLWQRLNLDIVAAIIALTGYAISVYLSGIENLLDTQTQLLVVSPLTLIAPIFLLLAAVLLFLRVFPLLLHLGLSLVMRGRGAVPMLALAQMARTPRQSLRMILLLALTTAFAVFTLLFAASQTQRAYDIAAYQVGADFSGDIPAAAYSIHPLSLQEAPALYQHLPGVLAATAGYVEDDRVSATAASLPIRLQAVDPNTFAQATLRPSQDSSQPLNSLLAQLAARRTTAIQSGVIPAIVDVSTWNALALHVGAPFSLYNASVPADITHYVAQALVQHMPAINSSTQGGIIVDYQSFAAIQDKKSTVPVSVNHIWLHTRNDPASLARVRAALNTPTLSLDNLADRNALTDLLRNDPLSLNLVGLLAIGAATALLLALIGNLLTSWLSVRRRLTNFTVLRTLGASPKEIASVLLWEQGIIYATALFLGIVFGVLLAITAIPALVFSVLPGSPGVSKVSNNEWYALQHAIPVQIVVPAALGFVFAALVSICIMSLVMMVRVVLRPSMSQVLRFDENQSSDYLTREDAIITSGMPRRTVSQRARRSVRPSIITLALWQLRHVWFLWLVQGVGLIAAIIIVCAVPLFSTVTTNAELHDMLTASPDTSEITLDVAMQGLSTKVFEGVRQQTDPLIQQHIGTYLSQPTPLSIQSTGLRLLSPNPSSRQDNIRLIGTSFEQAASNLSLVQGRLPQGIVNGAIETLLTPMAAQHLHATLGSVLMLRGDFFTNAQETVPAQPLTLRVVGLFNLPAAGTAFWHGETFQPVATDDALSYALLVPNAAFLAALDQLAAVAHTDTIFSPQEFAVLWRYRLDASRITADQLDDLTTHLLHLQASITNTFSNVQNETGLLSFPYLLQVNLFNPVAGSYDIVNTLDQYRNRTAVVSIPLAILSLQILALILFFVGLITNLLVDRQADTIAILRSRGGSSSQVFAALLIQSMSLGIIALIVGPLLAVIVVSLIAQRILGSAGQNIVPLDVSSLAQAALTVGWYAVGTMLVVLIVLISLLIRATRMNFLTIRREAARTTRRPLWQRLNLDRVAALIALVGFGISLYLGSISNQFDARAKTLIVVPLTLVAPIFLLISILIFLLRFSAPLLHLGERLAMRGRGMISVLALAQMARAPRQALRMTLLLALAIAFAIFTLVFSASQSQHILDIAAYESGADFSGDIPLTAQHLEVTSETALYRHIAGVISATVGFSGTGSSTGLPSIPMQIRAVDAMTFAQTAIWTPQDSSQSLASLMDRLTALRQAAVSNNAVPVIADAATMHLLVLRVGDGFTMTVNNLPYSTLNYRVIAEVQHIPTINDSDASGVGNASPGGVLLDYTTFATLYRQNALANNAGASPYLPINHVWLRAPDDPAALAHVRAALTPPALHLENLYDRQMLIESMRNDPLYLSIIIVLIVGAISALLLALVGDLLASWLSVRTRLTNFAVLRALGATPGQVIGVLLWEQGIVYAGALLLGVIFGAVLSATAVPTLVFTSAPAGGVLTSLSNEEFFIMQRVIPTHIVIPLSLELAFMVFVAICVLVLATIAGMVVRPRLGQALRLSED